MSILEKERETCGDRDKQSERRLVRQQSNTQISLLAPSVGPTVPKPHAIPPHKPRAWKGASSARAATHRKSARDAAAVAARTAASRASRARRAHGSSEARSASASGTKAATDDGKKDADDDDEDDEDDDADDDGDGSGSGDDMSACGVDLFRPRDRFDAAAAEGDETCGDGETGI
jgi:hypothetical protein